MNWFTTAWEQICSVFMRYVADPICSMDWLDVADILLLAVLLYELYRFSRNRRAGRVVWGCVLVVALSLLVLLLNLPTLSYLVRLFASAAFFCFVVIFQPEFRDALEKMGNCRILTPFGDTISKRKFGLAQKMVDETVDAVAVMSKTRTGALIVLEGHTKLGDFIETGKPVDSNVTSAVLQTIFYEGTPLHDGALIIRDMRICAAGCVLPSSRGIFFTGNMGTRHRAAVGVTEVSDALVIVVSEQTGIVSIAQNGKLLRDVDRKMLNDILMIYIAGRAYLRSKHANIQQEYLEILNMIEVPKKKEASLSHFELSPEDEKNNKRYAELIMPEEAPEDSAAPEDTDPAQITLDDTAEDASVPAGKL